MSEAITNDDTYIYIDSEAVITSFELSIRPVRSSWPSLKQLPVDKADGLVIYETPEKVHAHECGLAHRVIKKWMSLRDYGGIYAGSIALHRQS